jgi:hypothetical protein
MENKMSVVEILVSGNNPNGLRIIKLAGWIGKAFVIPRDDIKEIKKLKEANYPAVYFLFGEGEADKPAAYIGQTDNFDRRLNQQSISKEYWDFALVFTGESEIDVQYLENLCTNYAKKANRYEIKNSTGTPGRNISDFRMVTNNDFFEKIKFITSLLGYPLFQETPKEQQVSDIYYFEDVNNKDAMGRATLLPSGEFVVFANSKSRIKETPSFTGSGPRLRKKLIEENIIVPLDDKSYVFKRDYIFRTPSAAGDTVMGRATNGWTGWKDKDGNTLDQNLRK